MCQPPPVGKQNGKQMSKSQSPKKRFPPLIRSEKCIEKIKDLAGTHEVRFLTRGHPIPQRKTRGERVSCLEFNY